MSASIFFLVYSRDNQMSRCDISVKQNLKKINLTDFTRLFKHFVNTLDYSGTDESLLTASRSLIN